MMNQNTLAGRIAEYAADLRYEDISPDAVQLAKWVLFDSIGTGLGGYQRDLGHKAIRFANGQMPGDGATLLGTGQRTSIDGATLANGVMIKILGMDDSHRSASHIASQVIPAVMAVSEAYQTSGKDMIAAIVAAYDFAVRVGERVRGPQRERGLDVKGTVGVMAAALASARCMGLDANGIRNALTIAADMSAGTEQYVYEGGPCDMKDLIAGLAARNGVFAASLAANDFYGASGALDGEYGYFRAFGDGHVPDTFDSLGEHFAIVTTGFKPHGGCRHTHQAIDAVKQIQSEGALDSRDITHVSLSTYDYATRPSFRVDANPPSQSVAGLSIRVSTAVALARGSAWPRDFQHWDDPEVRRLRNLIDVGVDAEIQAKYPQLNGCRLTVTLQSGETREAYLPYMKGEPEFRMNGPELKEKFRVLTEDILDPGQVDAIYDGCESLESLADFSQLMTLTTAKERGERVR